MCILEWILLNSLDSLVRNSLFTLEVRCNSRVSGSLSTGTLSSEPCPGRLCTFSFACIRLRFNVRVEQSKCWMKRNFCGHPCALGHAGFMSSSFSAILHILHFKNWSSELLSSSAAHQRALGPGVSCCVGLGFWGSC